jgi:protein required for attachment to host cells
VVKLGLPLAQMSGRENHQMKTWILCADNLCAEIFMKNGPQDTPHLCYKIPVSKPTDQSKSKSKTNKKFVRYIAEEIEIACGAGTDSQLIICAEKEMLSKFLDVLSINVKQSLIGTIAEDLCGISESRLSNSLQACLFA